MKRNKKHFFDRKTVDLIFNCSQYRWARWLASLLHCLVRSLCSDNSYLVATRAETPFLSYIAAVNEKVWAGKHAHLYAQSPQSLEISAS